MTQDTDSTRKNPKQARAKHTVDTIIDATAQILEQDGSDGLSTNRLAARSGFSIGTIYQYFPNREAILLALIARQREQVQRRIAAAVQSGQQGSLEDKLRLIVRALHEAFLVHRNPARRLVSALLRLASTHGLPAPSDDFAQAIVKLWQEEEAEGGHARHLNDAELFVLSRAMIEVLRHATLHGSPLLGTPPFEDALVRLVLGFLRAQQAH